jgi:hypothetical protein
MLEESLMRHAHFACGAMLVAAAFLSGCRDDQATTQNGASSGSSARGASDVSLPSGTSLDVSLTTPLTSESARVGDAWTGVVRNAIVLDGRSVLPAGSLVAGTITSVTAARKGDRAMLDLELTSVTVGDEHYRVRGSMESVVAGSTRARNLGAVGATAVAGAVIGHEVGGSNGTVVGGLIGAGAGAAAVSQTKGWQVVLKEGTALTFTTNEAFAVRP